MPACPQRRRMQEITPINPAFFLVTLRQVRHYILSFFGRTMLGITQGAAGK
jgi:hypothetical protein